MSINLTNLERLPTDTGIELIDNLNAQLNEQADRIEALFSEVGETQEAIEFADILTWRNRVRYLKAIGEGKKANALAKKMIVVDVAVDDEEDEEGYKNFLATEFKAVD